MKRRRIYDFFFPDGRNLPFRKTRWMLMIIIQELRMKKFRAIFKYYYKSSYRKDIQKLRDILSKGKLTAKKDTLELSRIDFSHEINYPKWVEKLEKDLWDNPDNYKRIKVFYDTSSHKFLVIDGNHRLRAMKNVFKEDKKVNVLWLTYKKK